ncbi:PTS sugar transporter subunit IIC [Lactobacillus taiwanensis]|uniref:PTS sugar transporter subunit IIC n=1 Tax=Lactobacillus taiwanensis TaxID=508451 RepID=UPI001AEBDEAD|nr:PTS sugar transporter subunit IIC [Lactobacillus taiwanensis]QTQ39864.1 PTS sugar transporter subunit IIC [Lactobacillus taiwanensis]
MEKIIFKTVVRLRRLAFFRVADRTLMMLMPLAVVGSIFQFLWQSVFSPTSLISNIFYFDKWLPDQIFNGAWYACQGVTSVVFGTFGLFTAYFSAQYTARLYQKDAQMAGVSGMLALLLCAYRFRDIKNFQLSFNWRFLNINSFLFALLIGFGTGLIFRFLGVEYHHQHAESAQRIKKRAFNSFRPMLVTWVIGLVVGILASLVHVRVVATNFYQFFQNQGQNNLNLGVFIPLLLLGLLLNWLGIGQPLASLTTGSDSATNVANLNYALTHGSSLNVPNPYVGNSLYQSYGRFGGSGLTLVLLIGILIYIRKNSIARIARWSFIPTLFGSNQGALIGIPIMLNPLFLIPYVCLPVVNMLLGASMIAIHLIPVSAYNVLSGTPGPLVAFIATNGTWQALIFSMLLFALDILLYLPIVKMAKDVQDEIDLLNDEEAGYEYVK